LYHLVNIKMECNFIITINFILTVAKKKEKEKVKYLQYNK